MIVSYIQEKNPFPNDTVVAFATSVGLIVFVKGDNEVNDQLMTYLKNDSNYRYAVTQGYLKEGSTATPEPPPEPPTPTPVEVNTETATGGLTGVPSGTLDPTTPPTGLDDTATESPETGGTQTATGKLSSPVILDVTAEKQDDNETVFIRVDFAPTDGATAYKLQYAPTTRSSYTVAGDQYTESPIEFELPPDYKSVVVRLTALGDGTNTSNSDADISQTVTW